MSWFAKTIRRFKSPKEQVVEFPNDAGLVDSRADEKATKTSLVDAVSPVDSEELANSDLESSAGDIAYDHPFQNPDFAKYWLDLYEEKQYENRHLIDNKLSWTPREERRVVLKADFHALLWAFIMLVALNMDRYNLRNAVSGTLLQDLHLTTNDYNLGNTLNLVCFLAAELPSQLISKKVGADRFLPTQVVLWSLVAICQCRMKNKAGFLATRCLVGFFEGGFLPEQITWLSFFYKSDEFIVRSAWFYVANPLTSMFSGLLAAAIQTLDGTGGWKGWQYIFIIEGVITLVVGLLSFKMPASVSSTRTWYRPKGWFTDREEKIMVNRIIRDDPSKGTMNNREGVSLKMLWRAFSDYDMWLLYLSRFLIDIIQVPLTSYVPIILRSLNFSTVTVNLLMVPYNFATIITILSQSYLARRYKQYGWTLMLSPFWLFIPIICMRWWPGFMHEVWPSYGLLFVALCSPPSWAVSIAWGSANSYSVSRRTVGNALMNMFNQAASIVGNNIFQKEDAPRYQKGLESLVGISAAATAMVAVTSYYYAWRNNQRDKKWGALSKEEQIEYIRNPPDEGNKRLDFRFAL